MEVSPLHTRITSLFDFDKNSLLDELNIRKTELNVNKKNHKIWGFFSSPLGENLTGSFCSGIRGTKDRTSGLLSR